MVETAKRYLCLSGLLVLLLLYPDKADAQKVGVKTNLLYDVTSTANVGVEIALGRQWTVELSGNYNDWLSSESLKFKHLLVQPELRYWFCQAFNGHFMGLHAHFSEFSMGGFKLPFGLYKGIQDNKFRGRLYGVGISYGYQWILSNHWGMEATVGLGYARISYDRYQYRTYSDKSGPHHKKYLGPTKVGVSFIYLIK